MIKEITLPRVSENVEQGDVVKVLVNAGDTVDVDQSIIELETDKALFEVPSTEKGKVVEINVKEGETIKVGQVIIKIETDAEAAQKEKKEKPEKEEEKKEEPKEVKVEKKEEEEPKEAKGEKEAEPKQKEEKTIPAGLPEQKLPEAKKELAPASPSVRRLAREIGIDINEVTGTGPGGRITEDDVKDYTKKQMQARPAAETKDEKKFKPLPDFSKWGEIKHEPMSKIREVTAENMFYAWSTVPQVTQFDEADITDLEKFRKNFNAKIEDKEGHLTMTAILVKVISSALKDFPQFNASVDMERKEIIYKKYINIGIAVDTDRGLLVPVIKNADEKNLNELPSELSELSEKARNKKLTLEEMEGGNFTISNLGGIGGTNFSPIVYAPQGAILGVSRAQIEAKYINDKFEPRFILPLSLSYDHKLIDGADAARFLRWVCEALENPLLLTL